MRLKLKQDIYIDLGDGVVKKKAGETIELNDSVYVDFLIDKKYAEIVQ